MSEFDFDPFGYEPYGGLWILLAALSLLVVAFGLSRLRSLGLERDLAIASIRGFLQIMAIGFIIFAVFQLEDAVLGIAVLVFIASMVTFATFTSSRRARGLPNPWGATFWALSAAAVVTLGLMVSLRVLPLRPEFIIPISGMVVGNSMNTTSLAINRLLAEVRGHCGRIEARMLLGADAATALRPHVKASVRSAMIPTIDSLKTLGIVFIPGGMTGMVIGGVDPVWAAEYQLVIFFMLFCATMVSTTISTMLAVKQLAVEGCALVDLPEADE
jgi:putative ABC transport system permease protein